MTGIQLPKHLYRGQRCEMQNRSIGAPATFNNLLQAHLIQMHRMQNPDTNQNEKNNNNNNNPAYIDLSGLYNEQIKEESDAKGQNANVVEIEGDPAKVKKEEYMDENPDEAQASTSASVHVVDELRKVLESRKRMSESGTSRDREDEGMEVASSFSDQVRRSKQPDSFKGASSSLLP